jgi:hypothetical protein
VVVAVWVKTLPGCYAGPAAVVVLTVPRTLLKASLKLLVSLSTAASAGVQ